ncbi:MAG: penicillin-binding protein [Candidatus Pacebacteria bacterium]|nr:penicillin-binding protein [Candidatus Paceibacterota bacterium]
MFRRKKRRFGLSKSIFKVAGIVFLFSLGIVIFWVSSFKIPAIESFEERRVSQSTKIYDKTEDILLYDVFQNVKRTVVPIEEISRNIKNATIAIEDREFYEHYGVKPTAFLRAILVNLKSGEFSQGGSTITQQVVKNSLLTSEKSIARKLKEWVLAVKLEQILDKDAILGMYLNEIPYGGSVYGIEQASQEFLGKHAKELTLAEAAYMAALPQAPTYYSPYGQHRDRLEERKNLVLSKMLESRFITEEEHIAAREEKVKFKPLQDKGIKAPHFVMFVKEYLENKYGKEVVENGGLTVITTLDYSLQQKAEEIAKEYALQNEQNFNAENTAMVAIDPQSGGILVMVGSRDYFDKEVDGNFNVATAYNRQPGSSFKPFVYAEAFAKGYTPETNLFDLQTEFSTLCDPQGNPLNPLQKKERVCYMPTNYDGVFRGPVTMKNALAQSLNIPAVKTLYLAGLQDSLELARDMGISSLTDINQYGLTLVLGGGEVSLLDMTSAYGVFANEGVRYPYNAILEIRDKDGKVLEKSSLWTQKIIEPEITRIISDILSDNAARTPEFGTRSPLYFPGRDVAAKTGTTNDYRDAWIIGYTPNIAVGAWAGNNNNSPMEKKIAGFIIAPLWNAFMNEVLQTIPNESFTEPQKNTTEGVKPVLRGKWQGGVSFPIDTVSGKLASPYTPLEALGEILTGGVHSILYWVDKNNPQGPTPPNPLSDPQFEHWEYPVRKWVEENNIFEVQIENLPTTYDNIHTANSAPSIAITSPLSKGNYYLTDKITISFNYSGVYPLSKAEYFINDVYVGSSVKDPFVFSFLPQSTPQIKESNTLTIIVYDSVFNKREEKVFFSISEM